MNLYEHSNDIKKRAAIIIKKQGTNKFLVEHSYGSEPPDPYLDIPKGHLIQGETLKEGAIREIKEETGLKIKEKDLIPIDIYKFSDTGLAVYFTELDFKLSECKCSSKFKNTVYHNNEYNRLVPEVVGFELREFGCSLTDFFSELRPILKKIFKWYADYKSKKELFESILNIEYEKGWIEKRNPEPDKFHNVFGKDDHKVNYGISPSEANI